MQTPIDITFRDMTPSPALELTIQWAHRPTGWASRTGVVIRRDNITCGRMFQTTLDLAIPATRSWSPRLRTRVAVADAFKIRPASADRLHGSASRSAPAM
jgi:hypothetical protein